MQNIVHTNAVLAPATPTAIDKIDRLTKEVKKLPQEPFVTEHMLHGGMYTRTVRLPMGTVCTAVLVKPATVLITVGDVDIWSNEVLVNVRGYNVFPGRAGRKIAFCTRSEVCMSMIMVTDAKTVQEAEKNFTDEYELLVSLNEENRHRVFITGE